jgi:hypothetical protein
MNDVPSVPFYRGIIDKPPQQFWQRTAREGDGKATLLSDGIFLGLDNECRERLDDGLCILERIENRGTRGLMDSGHVVSDSR